MNKHPKPEKIIGIYPFHEDGEKIAYKGIQAIREGPDFYINSSFDTNNSNLDDFLEFNKADHVVGVMPAQAVFQRILTIPPVEPKRIPEIIRFEAIQQIPWNIKDASWNYKIAENSSSFISVVLSSVKKDSIKRYFPHEKIDIIETANDALPLLYRKDNQVQQEIQNRESWGILNIGKKDTLLLVYDKGAISWSRHIRVGSENDEIRENEDSDLIEEIKRSIGFYSSARPDSKIVRLISPNLSPDLSSDKGLLERTSNATGICTYYQDPYERFAGNFKLSNEYVYPAAGILASEEPINLFLKEKLSIVRSIAGSLLKKISEPISGMGRGIGRLGGSMNNKGERMQDRNSR